MSGDKWLFFLLSAACLLPQPTRPQNAICPLGFVWGGFCVAGTCQPSLPPFHCLLGSCCRDQRPLFARLGPLVYPPQVGIGGGGLGGGGLGGLGGFCFDSALNCYMFQSYCFISIYRVCMLSHCPRTCGFCGLGALGLGGLAGLSGGLGNGLTGFGGISSGLGGFGGGFGGGLSGLTGMGGLNGFG